MKLTKKEVILKRVGEKDINIRGLSKELSMDYSNLYKVLNKLFNSGLIEKVGDRGEYIITITSKGREKYNSLPNIDSKVDEHLNSRTTFNSYENGETNEPNGTNKLNNLDELYEPCESYEPDFYDIEKECLREWEGL